jgi:hypothetical protein
MNPLNNEMNRVEKMLIRDGFTFVAGVAALWAQKLLMRGENRQSLVSRLIGTATTTGMKPGFNHDDIGAGLVQAPQN